MIEHPPEVREILRRAGMSEASELTKPEEAGVQRAKFALAENPSMRQNTLYRIIRPRRDDE